MKVGEYIKILKKYWINLPLNLKELKHFICPKCNCILYMKLDLTSRAVYDRFCKSCNLMYKSRWDKICTENFTHKTDEEIEREKNNIIRRHGSDSWQLSLFHSGRYLKSFEESARPYKYQIMFVRQYQMDIKLALSPRRIEKWLKTPTKKIYADVPPLTEPAIKIPREFHEEYLEYRKKYLESES